MRAKATAAIQNRTNTLKQAQKQAAEAEQARRVAEERAAELEQLVANNQTSLSTHESTMKQVHAR